MNMSLPQMNKGFTLLELMIALALGLIVSAIAIQLTLTAQKSVSTQQAMSNLQSDALFGLEAVVRDVRLANLNASDVVVNDTVTHGGVVLDGRNYTSKRTAAGLADLVLVDALSKGEVANTSNLQGVNSDQLVIQYRNMMEAQFDCEGQKFRLVVISFKNTLSVKTLYKVLRMIQMNHLLLLVRHLLILAMNLPKLI